MEADCNHFYHLFKHLPTYGANHGFHHDFCRQFRACVLGLLQRRPPQHRRKHALFSLLGTTYGGDGQTTFALPDLRGRIPVGTGTGPGLPTVDLGEVGGTETITLTLNNLPPHSHAMTAAVGVSSGANDGSKNPAELLGTPANAIYAPANTGAGQLAGAGVTIGVAGGSQPFPIVQPYLALNYIICTEGIYPSRN